MAKARFQAHIRPHGAVGENVRRIIRARLTEMYIWAQYMRDESRAGEQHQLRIAAKRLRYTLELFREFLPEQANDAIKDLKGLQDALGLLHDCDVLLAILRSALFIPDGKTALMEALPEAQTVPAALLEVLGQAARASAPPMETAEGAESRSGHAGKRGKRHEQDNAHSKRHKKDQKGKRKRETQAAEASRSRVRPNAEQRAGLERFLAVKESERSQLYQHCVKRWEKLEARDFRAGVLRLVEAADMHGHAHLYALRDQEPAPKALPT
jgi:hypothetical protein